MSTLFLSLIIFGAAGYVVYANYLKKDRKSSCHDCDCPAKPEERQQLK